MKMVKTQGVRQRQKMSRRTIVVVAAASSAILITISLLFIFNIGNIRSVFASSPNPLIDTQWKMISNDGTYIKMQLSVKTDKAGTRMGDANFVFKYDSSAVEFSRDNLIAKNDVDYTWADGFGTSSGYTGSGTSVTKLKPGYVSINLNRSGAGTTIDAGTQYTPVITLNFKIINPGAVFNLQWAMDESSKPVLDNVFNDGYINFSEGKLPNFAEKISPNPKYVNLSGFVANQEVQLDWGTNNEFNSDHYTIERSPDGINFETIISKKAEGISQSKIDYNAIDPSPLEGISYYRLKVYDKNNNQVTYNTVKIEYQKEIQFAINSVNPTDFTNSAVLSYKVPDNGEVIMMITNLSGQVVENISIPSTKGDNEYRIDNAGDWMPGMYILSLTYKDKLLSTKIIKSRA